MRSLRPEQILLLLLFVLIPLLTLLVRWLQRRTREQQRPVPAESRPAEPVAREKRPPAPMPPRVRVIEPALPREGLRTAPPAAPPQPVIRRAGPLGGRAAVRKAVVAMTILGPCRGLEDPPPMALARRSNSRQP
ncbi:MAG: hypothetical protein ACRDHY_19770 [Anaerolineales bacterium]|jgi:hypothetical protein